MDRVRKGDFLVPKDDFEQAEETFEEKSERRQQADKALRGFVTPSVELYESMGGSVVDYPGVDTPTEDPQRHSFEPLFPSEQKELESPGGMSVQPDRESKAEQLQFIGQEKQAQGGHLWDFLTSDE